MAHLRRTGEEIGPSVTYNTREDQVHIAQEDTFVEVDGVRRLIKAGSTIPAFMRDYVKGEDVRAHDARMQTIEESVEPDSSKSMAERTGVKAPVAELDDSGPKALTAKSTRRKSSED
jgi:hypothetical protein